MGVSEFNQKVIDEFRANAGKVGGRFEGANLLLLHSHGAKSGATRINPLAYFADGEDFLIIASYSGGPQNPPWYHNLIASPAAVIEVGENRFDVQAEVIPEPERTEQYGRIAARSEAFAQYQQKTDRVIPIIRLCKANG